MLTKCLAGCQTGVENRFPIRSERIGKSSIPRSLQRDGLIAILIMSYTRRALGMRMLVAYTVECLYCIVVMNRLNMALIGIS
jgi:hypothetical protein